MNNLSISLNTLVSATKEQVSSALADDVVILDLKAGVYHGLNATGARIWSLLDKPRAVAEIRDVILSEFDVEPDRCERDLLLLLGVLAGKGLLEIRAAA